jgi:hypothetical protein
VAEVFCKCFVDSDSSWAHARCLLKIPVILWSRLGGGSVSLSCSSFCSCLCTCNGVMMVGSWILCLFLEDKAYCHFLCVCVCVWICPGCRLFDIQTVGSARLKVSDSQLSPLQGIGMQNCITFDRDGLLLATGGKVQKNLLLTIVWNLSTDCVDVVG